MKLVYLKRPEDFNPKMEVVSCFIELNGEILLLHRQDHKPQGGTWGRPSGKIDAGENCNLAMERELFEEVGLSVEKTDLKYHYRLFVRYPNFDFIYHIFSLTIRREFNIILSSNEHKNWKWVKPDEALKYNLIPGEDECIKLFYKLK